MVFIICFNYEHNLPGGIRWQAKSYFLIICMFQGDQVLPPTLNIYNIVYYYYHKIYDIIPDRYDINSNKHHTTTTNTRYCVYPIRSPAPIYINRSTPPFLIAISLVGR